MTGRILLAAPLLAIAAPASAELPDGVRAMIEAAIERGDKAKVDAVIEVARETHPGDLAEIDTLYAAFEQTQRELAAAREAAKLRDIRNAGLLENWSGKGEIGAFRSTGNSDNTGLTAGLQLTRTGIDWTHKLRGRADYQRTNGVTSREQFFAAYEPNFQISERVYAYGLAQYERDRFQGFLSRYSVSGGLGYQVIAEPDMQLSVKAGPAWRYTDLVIGGSESNLAALLGVDFGWSITDRLKLTQETSAVADAGGQATLFVDGQNTSLNVITGLDAKVSDKVTIRASYAYEYDSNPPPGAENTDTLTRFTFVYGF